jgi:hypothetical protein
MVMLVVVLRLLKFVLSHRVQHATQPLRGRPMRASSHDHLGAHPHLSASSHSSPTFIMDKTLLCLVDMLKTRALKGEHLLVIAPKAPRIDAAS